MPNKLHLLPGTLCNEKLWAALEPLLSPSLNLVYLDIPREKHFDELAGHYNDLLEDDEVNLIGFSLGGYIASCFATKYPERVCKLFVISNSPTRLPEVELKQRSDILQLVKQYGYKGMARSRAASMLDPEHQTDRLIDVILEMDREEGEDQFISQYQYTSDRTDLSDALGRFPRPAHFYVSERDRLVNTPWLEALAETNPNVSVITTAGSGHMLPLEKPQELADHILAWAAL